jgi:hypothetical protein
MTPLDETNSVLLFKLWVDDYNHERYHKSLDNVTPADVYEGRSNDILDQRAAVKSRTMTRRKAAVTKDNTENPIKVRKEGTCPTGTYRSGDYCNFSVGS